MADCAAIILAAGKASRYREANPDAPTKVVALYKGKPMVRHVADAARNAKAAPIVVVTGCEPELVHQALKDMDVIFAHNGDYASGIASSLKTGLAALPQSAQAVFILLGDMPLVNARLLEDLMQALHNNLDADAIVPVYKGQRGNPVLLARKLFSQAQELKGDDGARRILRDPALTIVEVEADAAAALDIDTPEALRQLEKPDG